MQGAVRVALHREARRVDHDFADVEVAVRRDAQGLHAEALEAEPGLLGRAVRGRVLIRRLCAGEHQVIQLGVDLEPAVGLVDERQVDRQVEVGNSVWPGQARVVEIRREHVEVEFAQRELQHDVPRIHGGPAELRHAGDVERGEQTRGAQRGLKLGLASLAADEVHRAEREALQLELEVDAGGRVGQVQRRVADLDPGEQHVFVDGRRAGDWRGFGNRRRIGRRIGCQNRRIRLRHRFGTGLQLKTQKAQHAVRAATGLKRQAIHDDRTDARAPVRTVLVHHGEGLQAGNRSAFIAERVRLQLAHNQLRARAAECVRRRDLEVPSKRTVELLGKRAQVRHPFGDRIGIQIGQRAGEVELKRARRRAGVAIERDCGLRHVNRQAHVLKQTGRAHVHAQLTGLINAPEVEQFSAGLEIDVPVFDEVVDAERERRDVHAIDPKRQPKVRGPSRIRFGLVLWRLGIAGHRRQVPRAVGGALEHDVGAANRDLAHAHVAVEEIEHAQVGGQVVHARERSRFTVGGRGVSGRQGRDHQIAQLQIACEQTQVELAITNLKSERRTHTIEHGRQPQRQRHAQDQKQNREAHAEAHEPAPQAALAAEGRSGH